jgi:hypothetical protein
MSAPSIPAATTANVPAKIYDGIGPKRILIDLTTPDPATAKAFVDVIYARHDGEGWMPGDASRQIISDAFARWLGNALAKGDTDAAFYYLRNVFARHAVEVGLSPGSALVPDAVPL